MAQRTGETLTAAIEAAIDQRLSTFPPPRPRSTLEEMHEAMEKFRRLSGLDKVPYRPFTKAEWDALWPTGIPEIDEA